MNWGYALKYRGTIGWVALATLGSPDAPAAIAQRLLEENPDAERAVVYDRPREDQSHRRVLLRIRRPPPGQVQQVRMPNGQMVHVEDWKARFASTSHKA